ncbi:MAG: hypothetical protein M1812_003342 [Candelaria pacifica]|nr:MAG: hypothetical protein M1812_003342 [Candelaria pacifica]
MSTLDIILALDPANLVPRPNELQFSYNFSPLNSRMPAIATNHDAAPTTSKEHPYKSLFGPISPDGKPLSSRCFGRISSLQDPSFCPFLSLPGELRNCIYEYLVKDCWLDEGARVYPGPFRRGRLAKSGMEILLVNKQLYHEASGILYEKSRFTFDIGGNTLSTGNFRSNVALMSTCRIFIHINPRYSPEHIEWTREQIKMLCDTFTQGGSLKSLTVYFDDLSTLPGEKRKDRKMLAPFCTVCNLKDVRVSGVGLSLNYALHLEKAMKGATPLPIAAQNLLDTPELNKLASETEEGVARYSPLTDHKSEEADRMRAKVWLRGPNPNNRWRAEVLQRFPWKVGRRQ